MRSPGGLQPQLEEGHRWNSYDIARSMGIERPYAHLREYVATRHRTEMPTGVTLTADALNTVRELKREEGLGIYLCGGGELAGALLPEIDRLVLKRNPMVLGDGIPLFGHMATSSVTFQPLDVRTFSSGVRALPESFAWPVGHRCEVDELPPVPG